MISNTRQRINYLVGDFLATNVAWFLFNVVRFYHIDDVHGQFASLGDYLASRMVVAGQILFPLLMLILYYLSGYYNRVFLKSRLQELVTTVASSFLGAIVIFFVALVNDVVAERMFTYELVLILFALFFVCVYSVRFSITQVASHNIHRRIWSFNTLIVGTSNSAVELEKRLRNMEKSMGFNVVGYVETCETSNPKTLNLPVFPIDELEQVCVEQDIKNLILIPHRHGIKATISLVNSLFPLDKPLYMSPDLYHLLTSRARLSNIVGEPLVDISCADVSQSTLNIKRMSDIVVSFIALILLIPLFIVLAIAIKSDSGGPVIYKQRRIGFHKKPFDIYKFRSMKVDAEATGPTLSSVNDPRITRIGRFLRKYRLDELPQFWNVLKGDMSLVGPRPEREYYIKQIVARAPYYSLIHQVRPGITSWGMVKYGYASDVDGMIARLRYDLLYIENVSLLVDLKILFYTVHTVFTGKGV